MGDRRMYSKKICRSARFLKMPTSSQNLYFHLGLDADDDGVVEAYPVMCLTGSTEDDLKILVAKELVIPLNHDLVCFITDWREHNAIRADRKVDSLYKDLLLQVVPNAELLEPKASYYSRTKSICQTNDGQMMDKCHPVVGTSKDNISKDKTSEENSLCPEPENPAQDRSGVLLSLVDGSVYDVPLSKITMWENAYPAVDIRHQLGKMGAWLTCNPTRRKTRRGIDRFINTWLSKEQDRGGGYRTGQQMPIEEPEESREYRDDVERYHEYIKDFKPSDDDPFQMPRRCRDE